MRSTWCSTLNISFLYRTVLFFTWIIFKVFYRLKIYGFENFYPGAAIIAGNHTSYLDPPMIAISWPQEVHFLAREGLFKNRFFGAFIRAVNSHPISGDASDVVVFKTVIKLLNEGKKIVLFPEGMRTDRDELGELKPGIALLVSKTKSAIIPTYIYGTYKIWNRFHKFPKLFGKTACVFGSPILWETYAHLDKKEAHKAITLKLRDSLNDLRQWYAAGAKGIPP